MPEKQSILEEKIEIVFRCNVFKDTPIVFTLSYTSELKVLHRHTTPLRIK